MRKNIKIIAMMAIMAFSFIAALGLSAQTTGEDDDLDDELTLVNDAGEQDLEALLARLSVEFQVDFVVLQDLSTQGYAPGEIWLALEISQATEKSLAETILMADGVEGHGWGILAQTIGIAPGSPEFHAFKQKWGNHQGNIFKEMKQERENKAGGKNRGDGDKNDENDDSAGSNSNNKDGK
ncbi:MAG TPA: hypothetical protein VN445_05100 [Rectinemataceae bacterium]|nr:hypothetical protein [Rectinemataceae bacterium]